MNYAHLMDRVYSKDEVSDVHLCIIFFQVDLFFQQLFEASSASIVQD